MNSNVMISGELSSKQSGLKVHLCQNQRKNGNGEEALRQGEEEG